MKNSNHHKTYKNLFLVMALLIVVFSLTGCSSPSVSNNSGNITTTLNSNQNVLNKSSQASTAPMPRTRVS